MICTRSLAEIVEDTAVELLRKATTELAKEYVDAMVDAKTATQGSIGRSQLENILTDIGMARHCSEPMCQDTGVVSFMIRLGDAFPLRSDLAGVLRRATKRATAEIPLRPNAVELFEGNTGDNTGTNVPIIHMELVKGDELEITAIPKGGGSSNVAAMSMLTPGLGLGGVRRFVIETVAKAGPLGCPPYFVGVGIGGSEDYCLFLAKKALLKPFSTRHTDRRLADLENRLLREINELGIGAMGLGEGPTALDLHIEFAARHPASMPVGVVLSCWALRHAKAVVGCGGQVTMLSDSGKAYLT